MNSQQISGVRKGRGLFLAFLFIPAVALLSLLLQAAPGLAKKPQQGTPSGQAVGLQWFDLTNQTVTAAAYPEAISGSRTWTVSWVAASRAIGGSHDPDFATAAFAQALHDTLIAQVPGQAAQLDAALATTLAGVPDGPAKDAGIAAGSEQAAAVLAERSGDGFDTASIDTPYSPPSTDPGVWQPTPPAFGPAARAGQGDARPFLITAGNQFDPGPPPALGSRTYRRDLAEVRAYGGDTGSLRTPEQTEIAKFWFPGLNGIYGQAVRAVLADSEHPLAWQARFVAAYNAITTDTQIAVYNAKFEYGFWRPVTAIRNDAVDPDPSWTPLSVTPPYPEWPSGHSGYAAAAQAVLTAFVGPKAAAPIALTSSGAPGVTRTYTRWSTLTEEIVDGRVWEGVHFRFSDEAGARLGKKVARWGLRHLGGLGV